jgi:hypothetical protein
MDRHTIPRCCRPCCGSGSRPTRCCRKRMSRRGFGIAPGVAGGFETTGGGAFLFGLGGRAAAGPGGEGVCVGPGDLNDRMVRRRAGTWGAVDPLPPIRHARRAGSGGAEDERPAVALGLGALGGGGGEFGEPGVGDDEGNDGEGAEVDGARKASPSCGKSGRCVPAVKGPPGMWTRQLGRLAAIWEAAIARSFGDAAEPAAFPVPGQRLVISAIDGRAAGDRRVAEATFREDRLGAA